MMLSAARFISIICQALFGVLGAVGESSGPRGETNQTGAAARKRRIAVFGSVAAAVFALTIQALETNSQRAQEQRNEALEQVVRSLQWPISNLAISVDMSVSADDPDVSTFLAAHSSQETPYRELD